MNNHQLFEQFSDSRLIDECEKELTIQALELLNKNPNCFADNTYPAHFTASAFIVTADFKKCLLTHHKKLNIWIQLGGHVEANEDLLTAALREAREESGLNNIRPVFNGLLNFDIHHIPANAKHPEHKHYDAVFLFVTDTPNEITTSDESHQLAWASLDNLVEYTDNAPVHRMAKKVRDLRFLN